jgi:hypothetical protein
MRRRVTGQDEPGGLTGRVRSRPASYHPFVVTPLILALGLVFGLIVLLPARRMQLAGLPGRLAGWYAFALWLGALLVSLSPAARFLVPIVFIAYLAPFIVAPERLGRIARRGRGDDDGPRPIKDVTPRDRLP